MSSLYGEDRLVQQTTAEYLEKQLGWKSVYAYNTENFGPGSLLGRASEREVVLTRDLLSGLKKFNPGLPEAAYNEAVNKLVDYPVSQSMFATNQDKYALHKNGVWVEYRSEKGELKKERLKVFDFEDPDNNSFLCVRELWIKGDVYRRRADIVGFVNGLPLLFMELKNVHKDVQAAYEQNFSDYKDTIPHLFHHNAIVMLGNGIEAQIGSLSSRYEHFHEWKRLHEDEAGVVDMETLLKGVCSKRNFMDILENFIVFDDSSGATIKILARNHQFLGVNQAIEAVIQRRERDGKLGVFWHTQGAGKSYSMVFFARKVHRKLGGNYTFLICTDRVDLDTQIYETFAGCGLADNDRDPCRPADGEDLKSLLGQHKAYVFTLVQKFNKEVKSSDDVYSLRDDIIVITDEAHRTQYGTLAWNMRCALPQASFIGFTGTPLFKDDEITLRVFGDYISKYDFQRAVDDKATVPLYYDSRGDKLGIATNDLNERIAAKLEELEVEDIDVQQRLEKALKQDYILITAGKRLDQVARDFVDHYSNAWENGKSMLVAIDKVTCVRMYRLIEFYWNEKIKELIGELGNAADEQEQIYRQRQIDWMKETLMAVVISEEQGEVERFRKWDLDIVPHRKLIKEGFILENGRRLDLDKAFKKADHPFRIVIVCAMWLTGFDVPSLSTLYLDKPLKAHTLMQAIARANRVSEGKTNGLVVDYCGILKNLRKALATYAIGGGDGDTNGGRQPAKPDDKLLEKLAEAIEMARGFLKDGGASLDDIKSLSGFEKNAAIARAKEVANKNDESRKRFEILCREVINLFRANINHADVGKYSSDKMALEALYKGLMKDRDYKDISGILKELQTEVDAAITIAPPEGEIRESRIYNIAAIDFTRLKKEFEKRPDKNTLVKCLKDAVEQRLYTALNQNPLRTDFQQHFESIVEDYNNEKDRVVIEKTFDDLLNFIKKLDEEEERAVRMGLHQENLAIFDLLKKDNLGPKDIEKIKRVSIELLDALKAERLKVELWREKEATKDAVKAMIRDFLYSEDTGLPVETYTDEEVDEKTELLFGHIYAKYPYIPSPVYGASMMQ